MKLVYSEQAVLDLVRLREFISDHNPAAASRIAHELIERIEHLRRFPEMGRRVEQAPDPEVVRDVVCGKYVVRYLFRNEIVAVLRVWHRLESHSAR